MSITLRIDEDLNTRNVYLCAYEQWKEPVGILGMLDVFRQRFMNKIINGGNDPTGRWVNQGDSVFITPDDLVPSSDEDSKNSSLSR